MHQLEVHKKVAACIYNLETLHSIGSAVTSSGSILFLNCPLSVAIPPNCLSGRAGRQKAPSIISFLSGTSYPSIVPAGHYKNNCSKNWRLSLIFFFFSLSVPSPLRVPFCKSAVIEYTQES
ncbi:Hypothetical predicted protein [Podarcis lilfordi]|uniref:Uncharacterized protein n=1 Tax=Podarcis lilfordi TaxID=74358 RepID=A0AA35P094_9SAUR|nr:Hypothetical predicted protein [Podarcis lilfordi]